MAKSFLLIGVGGSGGKTLRYAEREINRRLNEMKWDEGMPTAWRFLHIDVPHKPDVVEKDVPTDLGATAKYRGLAHPQRKHYRDYDDAMVRQLSQDGSLEPVAGWRPDPSDKYPPPPRGAGQRRVVGRVIAATQMKVIRAAIADELVAMKDVGAREQLGRLDAKAKEVLGATLGESATQEDLPLRIIVAASLGGGSGSGIFLDVLELLEAEGHQEHTMPVLFAADVFADLDPRLKSGIEPNSLAAVSELVSAFEHEGAVDEDEAEFLESAGLQFQAEGPKIGFVSFFVGRQNNAITYTDSFDVFRSTGKALSAFMLNPMVAADFDRYIGTNPQAEPVQAEFGMAEIGSIREPASSFGYANVTLGRSLFSEYLAERLARGAAETLLRGHRRDIDSDAVIEESVLVDIAVNGSEGGAEDLAGKSMSGVKAQFFEASGLWEESTIHNQVIDALGGKSGDSRALSFMSSLKAKFEGDTSQRTPSSWLEKFKASFMAENDNAISEVHLERIERARAWTLSIQKQLLEATSEYVGRCGLPVTIRLLDELRAQLVRAADELDSDRERFGSELFKTTQGIADIFHLLGEREITTQHEKFNDAIDESGKAYEANSDSQLYKLASELMNEIARGLIPPLKEALERSLNVLETGEKGTYGRMIQQWSDGPVPPHLMPAPNEFLLEPADQFESMAASKLGELFGGGDGVSGERRAIAEIISGRWPKGQADTEPDQDLIDQRGDWLTSHPEVQDLSQGTTGYPTYRIELTLPELRARAKAWVMRRSGIADAVSGSIKDWLSPDHKDVAKRGEHFVNLLSQALTSAAPLVSIDPSVHEIVHGNRPADPIMLLGGIPMEESHPAYKDVEKVLLDSGQDPLKIGSFFDPTALGGTIEISGFLPKPVHPVVFRSIFGPIYSEWMGQNGNSERLQFWGFRRSRPLPAFVPLSSGRQLALIRGWLVGQLLGQVGGNPLGVWTPRGAKAFPEFLVGRGVDPYLGALPALLETLPLALTSFANGDGESLAAYRQLLILGSIGAEDRGAGGKFAAVGGSGAGDFGDPLSEKGAFSVQKDAYQLGKDLKNWIEKGMIRPAEPGFPDSPIPAESFAGSASADPAARASTIAANLDSELVSFKSAMNSLQPVSVERTLTVPGSWEIRDQIEMAMGQLTLALRRYDQLADRTDSSGIAAGGT